VKSSYLRAVGVGGRMHDNTTHICEIQKEASELSTKQKNDPKWHGPTTVFVYEGE